MGQAWLERISHQPKVLGFRDSGCVSDSDTILRSLARDPAFESPARPGTTNRLDEAGFPLVAVTFAVKEWFVGGSQGTVTVDIGEP